MDEEHGRIHGLGLWERVVLQAIQRLADTEGPVARSRVVSEVLRPSSDSDPGAASEWPARVRTSSLHRAVISLTTKELIRETQWTNVLEVTPSGNERLKVLNCLERAEHDLKEARRISHTLAEREALRRRQAQTETGGTPNALRRPPPAGRTSAG